jgi:hypothetical protein
LQQRAAMLVNASFNQLTGKILGAAIEVHRALGPGLLESTYMQCLLRELSEQRLRFDSQRTVPSGRGPSGRRSEVVRGYYSDTPGAGSHHP